MGRSVPHSACLFAVCLLSISAAWGADQNTASRDAALAMQRGDFPAAEKLLRAEVSVHSDDAWALSLLGVALDNQKKSSEAEEYHRRAVEQSPHSPEILNNYGTHLWMAGQFDKAETWFASALAAAPAYFNALFNLGIMATYTGHYERAHEVLESALRQQPRNVDVLYRLASVEELTRQWESAVMRLAQAEKLDPRRADVQKLLAVTTTELGALDDAVAAWDRYLKLEPNDETARRERGYAMARMGKLEQGIAGLEWFLARHPDDPVGHYELAQAQRTVDMVQAMKHLDKALALDPNYMPARAARGSLYYQEGKPESALADLELAASQQPDDAVNLDRLGQTYQALDRAADAVRVLRKAAGLAPENSTTLLHFARALADAGQAEESKKVMDRFRQLGPEQSKGVPAGLVEYLGMTPEQRRADYRSRVERAIHDHPDDPAAQVNYLKLLLEDGDTKQAPLVVTRIAGMKPDAGVLADAGHALLESGNYPLAKHMLEQAVAAGAERNGDYYLAQGDIDAALRASPNQPQSYRQATVFLIGKGRAAEALHTIDAGTRALPDDRELLLMKATTLEFAHQTNEALALLQNIETRWPEWSNVWLAHGIILNTHQRFEDARRALETAVALGARVPEPLEQSDLDSLFQGTLFKGKSPL